MRHAVGSNPHGLAVAPRHCKCCTPEPSRVTTLIDLCRSGECGYVAPVAGVRS